MLADDTGLSDGLTFSAQQGKAMGGRRVMSKQKAKMIASPSDGRGTKTRAGDHGRDTGVSAPEDDRSPFGDSPDSADRELGSVCDSVGGS